MCDDETNKGVGLDDLRAQLSEALDVLEGMARQHCWSIIASDVDADAFRLLARHRRFRITFTKGRCVGGRWPENDPERKGAKA